MRKLGLLFVLLVSTLFAFSQEKNQYKKGSTLAIHFGYQDFLTPQLIRSTSLSNVLGNKLWTKAKDQSAAFGVSYMKGLSDHVDVSANYFFSNVAYPFRNSVNDDENTYALHELDASAHLKLLSDKHFLSPYVSAGLGGSAYKGGRFDAFIPLGVGLQFRLALNTFAFSNFQYRVPVTERANYHFLSTIGVGFGIGKPKPAPVVAPPPPPPPPAPVDTDGDGIVDPQDKCPTVKGLAKYQGCPIPDTDGDGINDEEDKCPTTAGLARYQGCPIPDKDADGINDEEDKCPDQPGVARYQGCPVPDRDGDGVNDEEDRCPDVAGIVSNYGCPEVKFRPENITFNTGSSVLSTKGVKELADNVLPGIQALDTKYRIEIQGHTDNTGNAKLNQTLSEKRAGAVKTWLVKKGIDASRLEVKGFGDTQPVEDNKTSAGRAKNRRVDFRLLN